MSSFQRLSTIFQRRLAALPQLLLCCGILVFSFVVLPSTEALPATVTLAWDPPASSPVPISGYKMYYGIGSRQYSTAIDVGNRTTYQVLNLVDGNKYYFAVTDYDSTRNESGYSNEVSYTVPVSTTPPTNRAPVASNGSLTTTMNTSASGTLVATDADGNALTYSLVAPPSSGSVNNQQPRHGSLLIHSDHGSNGGAYTFTVQSQ